MQAARSRTRGHVSDPGRAPPRFLDVRAALRQQPHDVVVVEAIEDHAAVAPRADDAQTAKQAELMRDGRLGGAEQRRQVAHAELGARQRAQHPDARRVAERLERLGQALNRQRLRHRRADLSDTSRVGVEDVTGVGR